MGLQLGGFSTGSAINILLSCLEVSQEVEGPGPHMFVAFSNSLFFFPEHSWPCQGWRWRPHPAAPGPSCPWIHHQVAAQQQSLLSDMQQVTLGGAVLVELLRFSLTI